MGTRISLAAITLVTLILIGPAGAASKPNYPVPYNFLVGVAAVAVHPGTAPPGSNDWSCKPSVAHPEPVVLVHGLMANMTDNWQTMSPLLANNGYCVFALTYGTQPGNALYGGLVPMEQSAQTLAGFVDRVLAATGAHQVDIVGHSEGATMPAYYVKFVGGKTKVKHYVGIAPVYHGTNVAGAALASGQSCASCAEFSPQSAFVQKLNAGGAAVPGVIYTNIMSRLDELVVPYTSGTMAAPNATNLVVQDQCLLDLSDHVALAADHIVGRDMLNALDPAHAQPIVCSPVLPAIGG
jgi:triacylglycerol lipase